METISISTGDLYDEAEILNWLMVQKDPAGELIEHVDGSDLKRIIVESNALAVYFCKLFLYIIYKIRLPLKEQYETLIYKIRSTMVTLVNIAQVFYLFIQLCIFQQLKSNLINLGPIT